MKWATPIRSRRVVSPEPACVGADAAFSRDFNAYMPEFNFEFDSAAAEEDISDIEDARQALADPSPRTSLADLMDELDI